MPIIIYFQFFKAILSFCLSNSYLCNPPASPPYRGCLESVIRVYIYHLLHHQCLDSGGLVLLPPIVGIMSASHLRAVLRVSISINNVNYFHLMSPYWHQSYYLFMCVWYMMKIIILSSVPMWHIVIFTHIWLFDEQNNDLQLSSVERFLANGRSARKQISNVIFISIWSERLIYCVLSFLLQLFLDWSNLFFYANANILRVCAAAHIKQFQTYCLNCAVICFSYIHINTALCRSLTLVNIRNGVQFTTTHKSGNQDRAFSWYSH